MTESSVVTSFDTAGVATVALNRPKIHNAFDDALIDLLIEELRRLEENIEVRCVVLTGNGDSFSAGADINWMRRMAGYSKKQNLADARRLAELMSTLYRLTKPTIARVNGVAFGGGVGLVACCDFALASEKASFCLSEVKLGLIPAVISPYLVRAVGERHARRYSLSAERFDAREAMRIGLVHKTVAAEDLDRHVEKITKLLYGNGPRAMAAAKRLVQDIADVPLSDQLADDTAARIAEIRVSDEGQEGLDAFLNKRKPDWVDADAHDT